MDYRLHEIEIDPMVSVDSSGIGEIFGGVLQRHRRAVGISQEELAGRADVDRTFVSRLERGMRQPTITTLIDLADALGISAATLVAETEAEYKRPKRRK